MLAVPGDFSLSDGRILAVHKDATGHYYVTVEGFPMAVADRLEAARHVFFALAIHDTDVAVRSLKELK